MRLDVSEPPAWPAHLSALSLVLVWIALGLLGWVVLAAVAFGVYSAVTLLL